MPDLTRLGEIAAGMLGSGGAVAWFSRRKTAAETHLAEASAFKTETDARHVHWGEMEDLIERLREEVQGLRERVVAAEVKADAAIKGQAECEIRERELVRRIASLETSRTAGGDQK
jgi:hypothetical protein